MPERMFDLKPNVPNARFELRGERYVGKSGPGNIFSRIVDWRRRDKTQIQSNKNTAQQFIGDLRIRYGSDMAQFATKQLSAHLTKGRPLSARRVGAILKEKHEFRSKAAHDATRAAMRERFGLSRERPSGARRVIDWMQERARLPTYLMELVARDVEQALKADDGKNFDNRNTADEAAARVAEDSIDSYFQKAETRMSSFQHLSRLDRSSSSNWRMLLGDYGIFDNAMTKLSEMQQSLDDLKRDLQTLRGGLNDLQTIREDLKKDPNAHDISPDRIAKKHRNLRVKRNNIDIKMRNMSVKRRDLHTEVRTARRNRENEDNSTIFAEDEIGSAILEDADAIVTQVSLLKRAALGGGA